MKTLVKKMFPIDSLLIVASTQQQQQTNPIRLYTNRNTPLRGKDIISDIPSANCCTYITTKKIPSLIIKMGSKEYRMYADLILYLDR